MTRLLLLASIALVAVSGAGASGATRTIGTRGKVVRISADGGNVAVQVTTTTSKPCESGSVWTPATGKVARFQDGVCGKDAPDGRFVSLTLAGSRAAWTDYDYGNHAYCIGPVVATLANPKAVDSGVCPEEPDNEDMHVEYGGDGPLLVARSYIDCDYSCGPDYTGVYEDDVTLYTVGSTGVKKLAAEKRNTRLLDVDAGRILLRDPKKALVVLDGGGRQLGRFSDGGTGAAFVSGSSQVASAADGVERLYDVVTGKVVKTARLKGEAKVMDVENGVVAYFSGTEVRLLTIATGQDRLVAKVKGLAYADLERNGLYYAYNVPGGGAKPGRVTFVPQ